MGGDKPRPYEIEASNISRNQIMPVGAGFIPARIGENKKMTEHKKLQPEIRFAGFTDDWEQCKLGSILKVKSGMSQKGIEVPNGQYPILATGGEIGRTNTAIYDKESVLIGRKGTIDKPYYMNSPFWTVDTLFYTELSVNIFALFIYYLFQKIGWKSYDTSTGVPSLTSSTIHNISVWIPKSKEEQTQIGNFFKQLDDTITLHQRTLEKYQKLKISYLEKMFPKENELYPELRFPNFTDAWEQRKLGEVVNVLDNLRIPIAASQRLEGVTPYYGANGIQGYIDGFTHDGEFVLVAEDGANDLINYPVQYVSGKVWINNHAHVLQGIKNVANNLFLVYRIKSMDMTKYLVGGGRTKLNASVMKDIELHLPNYAEQTQIGNFFKQLDDTIALHQREVKKYKKIKQSYLEKMFI